MTRQPQFPIEPPRTIQPLSRRGGKRLWLSAIVYLMACIWLGPHIAFWLTVGTVWTLFWFYLCGRFPILGVFTSAFLNGFVGGLLGTRGGYYGYGYYGTGRRRRWRW
jgi:hypothetical protein